MLPRCLVVAGLLRSTSTCSPVYPRPQNIMKLEEAQRRLEEQCGREPTLPEWAQAVGMSCKDLQSPIHIGRRCRDKMARSNFCLVIHIARKYQGYGLDIEDLVQDGCCRLMKTFEKFNPSKGCGRDTAIAFLLHRIFVTGKDSFQAHVILTALGVRLMEEQGQQLRGDARSLCTG